MLSANYFGCGCIAFGALVQLYSSSSRRIPLARIPTFITYTLFGVNPHAKERERPIVFGKKEFNCYFGNNRYVFVITRKQCVAVARASFHLLIQHAPIEDIDDDDDDNNDIVKHATRNKFVNWHWMMRLKYGWHSSSNDACHLLRDSCCATETTIQWRWHAIALRWPRMSLMNGFKSQNNNKIKKE